MGDFQLYFANFNEVQFLQFTSALTIELEASGEWEVEPPIEQRGHYTASAKVLKLFGKKSKDRKKLLVKIIRTLLLISTGASGGYLMLNGGVSNEGILFQIQINSNNQVNVYSGDRKQSVTLDSTKLEQEIHKIDSLN